MTHQTLLKDALDYMPEFHQEYDRCIKTGYIDADDGLHIVFALVFTPLVVKALGDHDANGASLFDFLEKMASSEDRHVQEVCDQSVLEILGGEYRDETLMPYFGEKTIEGLRSVRQYILEPFKKHLDGGAF